MKAVFFIINLSQEAKGTFLKMYLKAILFWRRRVCFFNVSYYRCEFFHFSSPVTFYLAHALCIYLTCHTADTWARSLTSLFFSSFCYLLLWYSYLKQPRHSWLPHYPSSIIALLSRNSCRFSFLNKFVKLEL